ncbi:MAG: polysaccharide biosynthesis/export family protein [Paludibacteraceae bacterium]
MSTNDKMLIKKIAFLLIISALSISCITSKKINYLQESSYRIPKYNDSVGYEEYKIAVGDRLFMRVLSIDVEMSTLFNGGSSLSGMTMSGGSNADLYTYLVKQDGTIQLPAVGNVYVFGQTLREAKKTIENSMAPYFKDRFAINLNIVERYFSIIGTQSNSRFPIVKEKMNIFQALAMAGDIDTYGDRSKIKIIRVINGTTQIKTFDVRSKDIINSEYYYIQPNDVIYIQDVKERFFSVTSFGSALATLFSSISFGLLIYNLAKQPSK